MYASAPEQVADGVHVQGGVLEPGDAREDLQGLRWNGAQKGSDMRQKYCARDGSAFRIVSHCHVG